MSKKYCPSSNQVRAALNKTDLTRSERAIIEAITYYLFTFDHVDLMDEQIAELAGFSSAKAVNNHMKRLADKGWLIRDTTKEKSQRSKRFLRMGENMLNALKPAETPAPQNVDKTPQSVDKTPQSVDLLNNKNKQIINFNTAREKKTAPIDHRAARRAVTNAVMDIKDTSW